MWENGLLHEGRCTFCWAATDTVISSLILSSNHQWKTKCDFHCLKVIKTKARRGLAYYYPGEKKNQEIELCRSYFYPGVAKVSLPDSLQLNHWSQISFPSSKPAYPITHPAGNGQSLCLADPVTHWKAELGSPLLLLGKPPKKHATVAALLEPPWL